MKLNPQPICHSAAKRRNLLLPLLFAINTLHAQSTPPAPAAPSSTHNFYDPKYHASFDYPADWKFTTNDHELSTFNLDARSAPRNARLRAIVAMPENPFPESTFSGAYLYYSITPHTSKPSCAGQTLPPGTPFNPSTKPTTTTTIAGVPFTYGHDEQRGTCTIQHDEIYTTTFYNTCYRFDLVINNSCGGDTSSVRDITPEQLDAIRNRLETILSSIQFGIH